MMWRATLFLVAAVLIAGSAASKARLDADDLLDLLETRTTTTSFARLCQDGYKCCYSAYSHIKLSQDGSRDNAEANPQNVNTQFCVSSCDNGDRKAEFVAATMPEGGFKVGDFDKNLKAEESRIELESHGGHAKGTSVTYKINADGELKTIGCDREDGCGFEMSVLKMAMRKIQVKKESTKLIESPKATHHGVDEDFGNYEMEHSQTKSNGVIKLVSSRHFADVPPIHYDEPDSD
jgi:hypothetical protein